jgi:hypothetical protein
MNDRRRKRAFAAAAVALLGITAVLALREPAHDRGRQPPADRATIGTGLPPASTAAEPDDSPRSMPPGTPTPVARSEPGAPRSERESEHAPAVAPREARAATAAARAFLDGYLPYSYGQSDAGRIRAATERLLRELEASPPRVPAAVARGRPRLISVRAQAATSDLEIALLAVVEDGQRRYRIPLAVRHAGHRWIVTAVRG